MGAANPQTRAPIARQDFLETVLFLGNASLSMRVPVVSSKRSGLDLARIPDKYLPLKAVDIEQILVSDGQFLSTTVSMAIP